MIAVVCPECGGDTLWRYPNLRWARVHVDLPIRYFTHLRHAEGPWLFRMEGRRPCPDPFAHVATWRKGHTS